MTRERRAFILGFRRGYSRALAKINGKVQGWEDEIAVLQADYETLINEIRDERAIQQATNERAMYPDVLLN